MRHTVARVDLDALRGNVRALRSLLEEGALASGRPVPAIIAVVKANAYGHGAASVGSALEASGVAMLACADVDEGVVLREAGIAAPILVFGALGISDLDGIFSHRLTPTISSPWAGRALADAAAARGTVLGCHVKIDTGMNRLGLRHDNLRRTLPAILAAPSLRVDALYTHFATADEPESELFGLQQQQFVAAREVAADLGLRTTHVHAANSAALLRDERVWFDAVRPGLLLYGIVPPPLMTTLQLEPALSLHSRIVAVKGVRDGEGAGYGQVFRAAGPRTLAVVPAGYADGVDWRLGNRGVVLVRGRRVPIVGRVSMDMLSIDVTGLDVSPGDEVVLLGRQGDQRIDVREVAATIGTIPWELLCRLGARIQREYCHRP
ncbi:alanine racemase [Luteitalea pratensis]|uniref:alanine racemase n=1 Tax=Luteitalea pratensis TaxID=1855912 RepID=UPI0012FFD094|nr:alanine racemase [Luteitalea pratensis]